MVSLLLIVIGVLNVLSALVCCCFIIDCLVFLFVFVFSCGLYDTVYLLLFVDCTILLR